MTQKIIEASKTCDIAKFLDFIFPESWKPIAARILESGVQMVEHEVPFAPRWSDVSLTVRTGNSELETALKSSIYRTHDCLHNLWGLPLPKSFSEEEFYLYKRAQMCGEVAVLTLTEFVLVSHLAKTYPELKPMLWKRNALPLIEGPLKTLTIKQIAGRLDTLLHRHIRSKWVRENKFATAFADDYIPMLEEDRRLVDHNWKLMQNANWFPKGIPTSRYSNILDGLELTHWIIDDFFHLMQTGCEVDEGLMFFNRKRRKGIVLPEGWNSLPV